MTTTIEVPLSESTSVEPVVTTVVTDTGTGEVVAEQQTERCRTADDVSRMAIGQVADAVVEAREEVSALEADGSSWGSCAYLLLRWIGALPLLTRPGRPTFQRRAARTGV